MDYKSIYTRDYFSGATSFFYKLGYGRFAKFYFRSLFRPLRPYVQAIGRGRVLDVGCAYGFMLQKFPDTFEKTGTDISDHAIAEARKRLPRARLEVTGAEDEPSFPDDFFDIVLCNDLIEHLENPRRALTNMRRVLRAGGILYITTPNLNWVRRKIFAAADRQEHHISLFPREKLLQLLRDLDFEIIDHWTYTTLPYFFFAKLRSNLGHESAFICRKSGNEALMSRGCAALSGARRATRARA